MTSLVTTAATSHWIAAQGFCGSRQMMRCLSTLTALLCGGFACIELALMTSLYPQSEGTNADAFLSITISLHYGA